MTDKGTEEAAAKLAVPEGLTPHPIPANHPDAGGDIHSYIGARLRQAFEDIARQPVPDRFLDLMRQLDRP